MYTAEDLLNIARAEIGYKEKKSNANLDDPEANAGSGNFTKYSRDLYAAGYYGGHSKQSFAWCCCFTDWCFLMAAGGDKTLAQNISCQSGIYGAACNYSAKYYQKAGRFDNVPSVGAQVYFGDLSSWKHTGLVEAVDSSYIYTIEGNASDCVKRKKYKRSDSTIKGYGHPLYADDESCADADEEPNPTSRTDLTICQPETFVLQNGSDCEAVRALQALLNLRGKYGLKTDGAFGPKTETAVKNYQKSRGLSVDGIAGPDTWKSILNNK